MGMFDTLIIKKEIPFTTKQKMLFPDVNWKEEGFQTKDLENVMDTYILKEDGKLYHEKVDGELIRKMSEEEEKKLKRKGNFCWPYEYKVKSRKVLFCKKTVTIFACHLLKDTKGNEWWLDLELVIVNGILKNKIKIKELKINRTKKQIKDSEERFKKIEEEHNKKFHVKFQKLMNRVTFNYWRRSWRNITRVIEFVKNKLESLRIFIFKYIE
jgi:hypothetical protein